MRQALYDAFMSNLEQTNLIRQKFEGNSLRNYTSNFRRRKLKMAPINRAQSQPVVIITTIYKRILLNRKRRYLRWNLLLLHLKKSFIPSHMLFDVLLLTRSLKEVDSTEQNILSLEACLELITLKY